MMKPGFTSEKMEPSFSPVATFSWSQSPVQAASKQAWQVFAPLQRLCRFCRHAVTAATQLFMLLLGGRCYTKIRYIDLLVSAVGRCQHLLTTCWWSTKCISCLCLCFFFFPPKCFFFFKRIYFCGEILISESRLVVICSQRDTRNSFLCAFIHTKLNSWSTEQRSLHLGTGDEMHACPQPLLCYWQPSFVREINLRVSVTLNQRSRALT